jgi:hypothetical protein
MEFKGTKGKWEVGSSKRSVVNNEKVIARMCFNDGLGIFENDEPEYNAKLISKAPEMLDTLKNLVSDFDNLLSEYDIEWQQAGYLEHARQLIKQATELK